MAISIVSSPVEYISSAFSSAARSFLTVCEEIGRARAAKVLYHELSCMSDEELGEHGLKRNDISRTVYSKVYDVR
ncbi:hypothetical protein [Roseibium algae]|uniref:DUF1127 domain-containing protein n=1 Tax=Roseibium algae TaxID=3123038 RepID=A0ABU8TLC6_9HYPH